MDWKPQLRTPTWFDFVQALERAGRAFVVAFIALYPLQALTEAVTGSAPFDSDLAKKAAVAGLMAAGAFLWRWLLADVGRTRPAQPDPVALAETHATHPHEADAATDD